MWSDLSDNCGIIFAVVLVAICAILAALKSLGIVSISWLAIFSIPGLALLSVVIWIGIREMLNKG